jgi:hypothetical protein
VAALRLVYSDRKDEKMKISRILVLLVSSAALVNGHARSNFNYDYVEAAVYSIENQTFAVDIEGDGAEISGSFDISPSVNLLISRQSADFDFDLESDQLAAGIGFHTAVSYGTDIQLMILYLDTEVRFPVDPPGTRKETGHSFEVGIRHALGKRFEINFGFAQPNYDGEAETGFSAGGRFRFNKVFLLGATYSVIDKTDSLGLGLRAEF